MRAGKVTTLNAWKVGLPNLDHCLPVLLPHRLPRFCGMRELMRRHGAKVLQRCPHPLASAYWPPRRRASTLRPSPPFLETTRKTSHGNVTFAETDKTSQKCHHNWNNTQSFGPTFKHVVYRPLYTRQQAFKTTASQSIPVSIQNGSTIVGASVVCPQCEKIRVIGSLCRFGRRTTTIV